MATQKHAAEKKQKPAKRPWRFSLPVRILSIVAAVLLILSGSVLTAGGIYIRSMLNLIQYVPDDVGFDSIEPLPEDVKTSTETITNIMLLGVDGRRTEGYAARSDTNMILSINAEKKTIKLASLLRDTWVPMSGLDQNGDGEYDIDKLNAAFYHGGFRMLSNTIRDTFRIHITKYIAVDFVAFEKAVDAMDGIDVELTAEEAMFIPEYSDDPDRFATPDNPDLSPLGYEGGVYHLNGQQTLAYCRIRNLYTDSDFARQSNQRKVIDLLMSKAKTMNFAQLTNVLVAVLPYVQTNLTQDELFAYATQALQYMDYSIYSDFSIPSGEGDFTDHWVGDGLGLLLTDTEASKDELHEYIYGDLTTNRTYEERLTYYEEQAYEQEQDNSEEDYENEEDYEYYE